MFGGDNSDTEDECKKGSNRSAGNKKSEQGRAARKAETFGDRCGVQYRLNCFCQHVEDTDCSPSCLECLCHIINLVNLT